MPRTVTLKKRQVILNNKCNEIFKALNLVLSEMSLSFQGENSPFSSVHSSNEIPVDGSAVDKAKRLFEQAFDTRVGGHKKELSECSAKMDTGSYALFRAYQDFWVQQMRQRERISAEKIEGSEIKDPYVLIMEIYLRLAMQALRQDSPLQSDQDRRIFIQILLNFGVKLSQQNQLSKTLQAKLFNEHKKWLDVLVNTADQIDQMNKATPILGENLRGLELLENNIKRYLIMALAGVTARKNIWKDKLSENQLNETLRECEDMGLNMAKQEGFAKAGAVEEGIIEVSLIVQKFSVKPDDKFDTQMSEKDLVEHDLVDYGLLSIEEARRQKDVIAVFANTDAQLKIKYLYGLWNKTKIIYQFVGQIDNLVQSAGWLPLLFHVIELHEVDKVIDTQFSLCNMVFNICGSDKYFFNTCLGKELGECTHTDFGSRKSLPKLELLQNPELLLTVLERMTLDFNRLAKLGALSGCQVTCNPFLRRTVKSRSESEHIAYASENFAIAGKPDDGSKLLTTATTEKKRKPAETTVSTKSGKHVRNSSAPASRTHSQILSHQHIMLVNPDLEDRETFLALPLPFPNLSPSLNLSQPQSLKEETTLKKEDVTAATEFPVAVKPEPSETLAEKVSVIEKIPIKQEKEKIEVRPSGSSVANQNQPITIEMPSIEDMPSEKIVKRENEVKKEETKKRLYPAKLPYIQAIVHALNLTAPEVAQASETFNTNKDYFKQEGFSPFRLAVVKVIKDFHEHYMSSNEPESLLDDAEIWRQRCEEIRILQYFCTGPIDDSRLIIFIGAMIASATIALFPTKLKYNYLVNELEKILKSHYNGDKRFEAYLQPDINAALLAETETLRQTTYEVREKNTQLTQDLEKLKREAAQLQKDYKDLQTQYVSSMKNLTNKVEQLQGDVEAQKRRHEADMQNLKTEFGAFFQKPGAKQNIPEPLPSAEHKSISCNIL